MRSFIANVDALQRLCVIPSQLCPVTSNSPTGRVRFNLNTTVIPQVFAASSATKEEIELGKKQASDTKSQPVETSRRIWRPQVTSEYKEPDCVPDVLSDMEILYKDDGKPSWVQTTKLPPRNDIIKYAPTVHDSEL